MEHLVRHLGPLREEVLLALFYDGRGRLLGHLLEQDGAPRTVSGRYRALIEPALRLGAAGLALVHNHPSGDPSPSGADTVATRCLQALSGAMELEFLDHVIIGGRAAVSMRRAGLMAQPHMGTLVEPRVSSPAPSRIADWMQDQVQSPGGARPRGAR